MDIKNFNLRGGSGGCCGGNYVDILHIVNIVCYDVFFHPAEKLHFKLATKNVSFPTDFDPGG